MTFNASLNPIGSAFPKWISLEEDSFHITPNVSVGNFHIWLTANNSNGEGTTTYFDVIILNTAPLNLTTNAGSAQAFNNSYMETIVDVGSFFYDRDVDLGMQT